MDRLSNFKAFRNFFKSKPRTPKSTRRASAPASELSSMMRAHHEHGRRGSYDPSNDYLTTLPKQNRIQGEVPSSVARGMAAALPLVPQDAQSQYSSSESIHDYHEPYQVLDRATKEPDPVYERPKIYEEVNPMDFKASASKDRSDNMEDIKAVMKKVKQQQQERESLENTQLQKHREIRTTGLESSVMPSEYLTPAPIDIEDPYDLPFEDDDRVTIPFVPKSEPEDNYQEPADVILPTLKEFSEKI